MLGLLPVADDGATPAGNAFSFPLDYGLPAATIFIKFARQILKERDNLDVFVFSAAMPRFSALKTTLDLPSWVPDWRFRKQFKPLVKSTDLVLGLRVGTTVFMGKPCQGMSRCAEESS